jgi:hypothetical protein
MGAAEALSPLPVPPLLLPELLPELLPLLVPVLLPLLLHALHASSMANNEIFNQEEERGARSLIA